VRAFPFQQEVIDFINEHETIFVIEQNRDAQLRTVLMTENALSPRKLQAILNFDGLPITADFITEKISELLNIDWQNGPKGTEGGKA
jgi:2-oxoglutarate ferredoxin oxidoreductase subunit alpha